MVIAGCKKGDKEELTFIRPNIIATNPSGNATGVRIKSKITAFFDEAMDSSTINTSTFRLYQGTTTIPGTVTYSDKTAIFIPANHLETNTIYTATITNGVQDVEHHSTENDYSWNFTTKGLDEYEMTKRSVAVTDFVQDGSQLMQMGNYMYSYGGWTGTPEESYNYIYRSDGDLSTWKKLPDAPWHPRHTFGLAKLGSTLYVFGGDYIYNVFDVWSSTDGEHFKEVANDLQSTVGSRILYGACAHNNKLFVLGGQEELSLDFGLTDIWSSADGITWTQIAKDKTFLGKNIAGSVVSFNGKIWVIGGGYYDHPDPAICWTNHVYSSPDGITWKQEPDAPWAGRQYADVCVWDNKLWMVGGNNGDNLTDIWYLKKDGTWVPFEAPAEYTGRHATAVGIYNNNLVITCGNDQNDCWVIKKVE